MTDPNHKVLSVPRNLVYGYDPEDVIPVISDIFEDQKMNSIVDIGSGNGIHAIAFARAFPAAEVFATEPNLGFFGAIRENVRATSSANLQLLNLSIEEFYEKYDHRKFDFVHCSMVLPFVENIKESIGIISELISETGFSVVSLFAYPKIYSTAEIEACDAYMKKALPKVKYFPSQTDIESLFYKSGISTISNIELPLPNRYRDDDVCRYKAIVSARRREIELEVKKQFNLEKNRDLILAPVSTFILQKS
jgi:predicted TPR repeat methyltransferase